MRRYSKATYVFTWGIRFLVLHQRHALRHVMEVGGTAADLQSAWFWRDPLFVSSYGGWGMDLVFVTPMLVSNIYYVMLPIPFWLQVLLHNLVTFHKSWSHHSQYHQGRAVQVDPINPTLKAPGSKGLKLRYDKFAFDFALILLSIST